MFVVTVQFTANPANLPEFREAVIAQAKNSLALEQQCHQFDVSVADDNPCIFLLYEVYGSAAAFNVHLESEHFRAFDQLVTPWVTNKVVKSWGKL
jgi:autoinducer 2-degrading protein